MAQLKLFEVTLKYFICTDSKERAEEEMLKGSGGNYTSMILEEIKAGVTFTHPEPINTQEEEDVPF